MIFSNNIVIEITIQPGFGCQKLLLVRRLILCGNKASLDVTFYRPQIIIPNMVGTGMFPILLKTESTTKFKTQYIINLMQRQI